MALEYFLGGDTKTCKEPGRSDPKDHLVGPSVIEEHLHPSCHSRQRILNVFSPPKDTAEPHSRWSSSKKCQMRSSSRSRQARRTRMNGTLTMAPVCASSTIITSYEY